MIAVERASHLRVVHTMQREDATSRAFCPTCGLTLVVLTGATATVVIRAELRCLGCGSFTRVGSVDFVARREKA